MIKIKEEENKNDAIQLKFKKGIIGLKIPDKIEIEEYSESNLIEFIVEIE